MLNFLVVCLLLIKLVCIYGLFFDILYCYCLPFSATSRGARLARRFLSDERTKICPDELDWFWEKHTVWVNGVLSPHRASNTAALVNLSTLSFFYLKLKYWMINSWNSVLIESNNQTWWYSALRIDYSFSLNPFYSKVDMIL